MESYGDSQPGRSNQLRSSSISKNIVSQSFGLGEISDRGHPPNIYSVNRYRESNPFVASIPASLDANQRNLSWFVEPQQDLSNLRVIRRSHSRLHPADQQPAQLTTPPAFLRQDPGTAPERSLVQATAAPPQLSVKITDDRHKPTCSSRGLCSDCLLCPKDKMQQRAEACRLALSQTGVSTTAFCRATNSKTAGTLPSTREMPARSTILVASELRVPDYPN